MKTVSDKHSNLCAECKKAILVVSYGTSRIDTIENTIGAIESAIAKANADHEVRRAFTSRSVIDTIREKYAEIIDNAEQALDKLIDDGIKAVAIQPTHILCSYDCDSLVSIAEKYKDKFEAVSMGAPLLTSDNDYTMLVNALADEAAEYSCDDTALIFVGHGTEHIANHTYSKLQDTFASSGRVNCFVATLNAGPSLNDVAASVKADGYQKVVLRPLMIAAGVHTLRDIAGDDGSWKSAFEAEGFEVRCIMKGMGELQAVQDIYAAHASAAVSKLDSL